MKTIYLAARYSRRVELCGYRDELRALGFNVQARWLDGNHQLDKHGIPIGESGENLVEDGDCEKAALLRCKFAQDDYADCATADIVISFTEEPRALSSSRGGRHVEFGIAALASCKRIVVIGHRENIFHWLDCVEFFQDWESAKKSL